MFLSSAYQRIRLQWRANRAARRADLLTFGEMEIALFKYLVPRRAAIDIGANKGTISCLLLKYCSKLVAFEPNPVLFRNLSAAIGRDATVINKAVSDNGGPLMFYIPKRPDGALQPNMGSLRPGEGETTGHAEIRVEGTTIDQENIADVGFIKIDTEGTELDVIRGAMRTIERDRPVLMVEINDKTTAEAREVQTILRGLNYSIVDFGDRQIRIVADIGKCRNRNIIFMPNS